MIFVYFQKNLRGYTIAKLYYKISEYGVAQHYTSGYLSVKEDNAAAHKLLGQCLQQLNRPEKAIASYKRSLQLDSKQPDLIIEGMQHIYIHILCRLSKINLFVSWINYVVSVSLINVVILVFLF